MLHTGRLLEANKAVFRAKHEIACSRNTQNGEPPSSMQKDAPQNGMRTTALDSCGRTGGSLWHTFGYAREYFSWANATSCHAEIRETACLAEAYSGNYGFVLAGNPFP